MTRFEANSWFCRQTQEVQKAMDEKKFEEAVRLRGRYLNAALDLL